MRTVNEIKKSIRVIDRFIASHKKQVDCHLSDECFDIDKACEYGRKIQLLETEKSALEWVLNESS